MAFMLSEKEQVAFEKLCEREDEEEDIRSLLKKLKSVMYVSTNYSWNVYVSKSYEKLVGLKHTKEIGKVRAYATELMVQDYLNKYIVENSISGTCIHNDELKKYSEMLEKYGIKIDSNQSGYDLLLVLNDSKEVKKIQVKHRNTIIHLETTRRNSMKNVGKNGSGFVSYIADEFDYLIVVKGTFEDTVNPQKDMIIFPTCALLNAENNGMLVNRVSKKAEDVHRQSFGEWLEKLMSKKLK